MRRWLASAAIGLMLVAGAAGAYAQQAFWETSVRVAADTAAFELQQQLALPLSRLLVSSPPASAGEPAGFLLLRHTVDPDGAFRWGASLSARGPTWSGRLFIHEPHDTSPDPFRLYHASVRAHDASGASLTVSGRFRVAVQYVDNIPLRGLSGPLLSLHAESTGWPMRLGVVAYGSERLRHRFVVADGDWRVGAAVVSLGAAIQDGVELTGSGNAWLRRIVDEHAVFARVETAFGRHRVWVLAHETSPGFRSLAASSYPFRRGALAVEGRWQWRPETSRLVSVYAQRRWSGDVVLDEAEAAFSAMPRGRWGYRIDVSGRWDGGVYTERGWTVTVTNPDRRFRQVWSVSETADGQRRRQVRFEWEENRWRARLSVDDGLPGWRLEARWSPGGWNATVVYKQRTYPGSNVQRWLHAALTYDVPGFGQWWIQWRDGDNGRLDVGWNRPAVVSAGLRVSF